MDLLRVYQTEPRAFRLIGELDLSCLDRLDPIEALASSPGDVSLDLTRLTFVDGSGLERICRLARRLARTGNSRVVALRPQRSVERALKRTAAAEGIENLVVSRLSAVMESSFEIPDLPRDLGEVIVSDYPPEAACKLVAEVALSEVTGTRSASVAVRNAGAVVCAASSDQTAEAVQNIQIRLGEGPAIDALTGSREFSASLLTERRWPKFTNAALYRGIASVLAEPLQVHGSAIGTLTLFSPEENSFSQRGLEDAARIASGAAVVIANSILYWQTAEAVDQLREALESRAVIDQAKGMLMARERITAEEAFEMLLRASQRSNMKVRDIAQRLVADPDFILADRSLR